MIILKIHIPAFLIAKTIRRIEIDFPIESCGIFAGHNNTAIQVIPITNKLNSPTEFYFSPQEMLNALYEIEEKGLTIIAYYHSHSVNLGHPSETDQNRASTPDTPHVIFYRSPEEWKFNGFLISKVGYKEIEIESNSS